MSDEVKVIQRGTDNPMIVVSAERVKSWLRTLADEAGFADRETCMVQLTVSTPFYAKNIHHEAPELLIMVSNIRNSRKQA